MSYRRFNDDIATDDVDNIAEAKKRRMGPIAVLCVVLMVAMTSSLVFLRIKGLSLDSRLDSLGDELVSLERAISDVEKVTLAMASPCAVYGYAFDKLGMVQGTVAGTVKIRYDDGRVAVAVPEGDVGRWSGALPSVGVYEVKGISDVVR